MGQFDQPPKIDHLVQTNPDLDLTHAYDCPCSCITEGCTEFAYHDGPSNEKQTPARIAAQESTTGVTMFVMFGIVGRGISRNLDRDKYLAISSCVFSCIQLTAFFLATQITAQSAREEYKGI